MNADTQAKLDAYKAAREKMSALELELQEGTDNLDEWGDAFAEVGRARDAWQKALKQERERVADYIVKAYGFVMPAHVQPEYIKASEFAELIERTFSRDEPRNAWAIDKVRGMGGQYARTHAGYHYIMVGN